MLNIMNNYALLFLLEKFYLVCIIFTARRYAERGICYGNSVRPSVCPSVRPSHGWISQKRL